MFANDYNQPRSLHQTKPASFVDSSYILDTDTGELVPKLKYDLNGRARLDKNPFDARSESRIKRYMLQSASASVLKGERVCKCGRVRISDYVGVMTGSVDGSNRSHYAGLMQCGSVWHCPVCSAKIAERRATELREAFDSALSKGWFVSHFTFTFPHRSDQSLQSNLDSFLSAYKKFWDSKPIRGYVEMRGIEGRIRALEVTYNHTNGWHPHIHLLVVSNRPIPISDKEILYKVWADKCVRSGLSCPSLAHGLSIQDGSSAGEYINKFADDSKFTSSGSSVTWDMADELTKLNSKTASKGFTPFDFLRVISNPGSFDVSDSEVPKYRALFAEYAKCFKGKSQLEWGRGKNWDLRKKLGLSRARTDEEVVNEQVEDAKCTVVLTDIEWRIVRGSLRSGTDSRGHLLTVAESAGFDGVAEFLYSLVAPDCSFTSYRNQLVVRTLSKKDFIRPSFLHVSESKDSVKFGSLRSAVQSNSQQPFQPLLI